MENARDSVILVEGPEGALSVELVPLEEGASRGFLRFSPRNVRPSKAMAERLGAELSARPFAQYLICDSRKRVLEKTLGRRKWTVSPAVPRDPGRKCSTVTTFDLPSDESLVDNSGSRPDVSGTSHMSGLRVEVDGRPAWAFYTDDGENARVVSEGERKQGMLVAQDTDDMRVAADCLVRFLATTPKKWAVFSASLGRFVRQHRPIEMWRMELDSPKPFDHKCVLVSDRNKKAAIRLFSEYYDEPWLQSVLRLRKLRSDGNYWTYILEGGFVTVRLEGETGLIYDIYVTPSMQGKGLGGELMRCALTSLAGRVSSVYLHTSFPRAKSLYENFGFRTIHTQLGIRLDEMRFVPPARQQSM